MAEDGALPAHAAPNLSGRPGLGAVARIRVDLDHRLRRVPILQHCVIRVDEGVKEVEGPDGPVAVRAGDLIALPAGAMPTLSNRPDARSGRYRATALAVAPEVVAAFARHPPMDLTAPSLRGTGDMAVFRGEGALADAVAHAATALAEHILSDAIVRHRLLEVLLALAERGVRWSPAGADGAAQRIRLMVAGRPDAPWTAADAARLLNVSEPTLRRRLAAEGTSFRALLAESRLSHGLMLLQTSRASVTEVALACGYESPSRFAARFRDRFGTPPSAIRTGDERNGTDDERPRRAPAEGLA